jgi:hypothetical protein
VYLIWKDQIAKTGRYVFGGTASILSFLQRWSVVVLSHQYQISRYVNALGRIISEVFEDWGIRNNRPEVLINHNAVQVQPSISFIESYPRPLLSVNRIMANLVGLPRELVRFGHLGKLPGIDIRYANPHNEKQYLDEKVPIDSFPPWRLIRTVFGIACFGLGGWVIRHYATSEVIVILVVS